MKRVSVCACVCLSKECAALVLENVDPDPKGN
jgi:hypothetical protein